MVFTVLKSGTTPPGEIDGACAGLACAVFARAAIENPAPACCLAMANLTALINGAFLELARYCLAAKTLAMDSAALSRTPLPMICAEALVAIAMAEPVTAAYICQFPAVRFSDSLKDDARRVPK